LANLNPLKKGRFKNIDYDRLALRIFVLSIVALFVTVATLFTAWFFNVDYSAGELWLGAIVVFIATALIYIAPLYWKIVFAFFSVLLLALFLTQILGLPLFYSLIGGLAAIVLVLMAVFSL